MAKSQVAAQAAVEDGFPLPPREHDIEILQDVREVDFILDQAQVAEKGIELAGLGNQIAALKAEKSSAVKGWNELIKELDSHRRVLDKQIAGRTERRNTAVYVENDLTTNTVLVRRADTNEIVEPARELKQEEREAIMKLRQTPIPGTEDEATAQ